MDSSGLLQDQLRQAHQFLNGTVADITDEQAQWQPDGCANPLGATYAHVLFGEDAFVAMLSGGQPLFAYGWQGRTGVSEPPPLAAPGSVPPVADEWQEWGRDVHVDMGTLRAYGQAVQQVADTYLGSLRSGDLDRSIDLSAAGFGEQSLAWLLSAGLIGHVLSHWGEIACLKGLQGGRGFPV
jgi:hypothetical protein